MWHRDLTPAVLVAIVGHIIVLGLVGFTWSTEAEVTHAPKIPPHVKAVVMEKPKPKAREHHSRPKPKQKSKPKPKPKPEKKVISTAPAKKKSQQETKKEEKPSFSQPDMARMLAREELDMQKQSEQAKKAQEKQQASKDQSDKDATEVAQYVADIKHAVAEHWTRPPSARNGMETVVRIHLLPGGEVVDVSVVKSSGDAAMDRSTVAAVKNASPLPVPSGSEFDENFRVFRISFKPEDLRL